MDQGSGKRSDETRKTGASANLEESPKKEGVAPNFDLEVEEVNPGEQTIERLLEENKELEATVEEQREDIRKFQERQITSLELVEALKVTLTELRDRLKRIERTETLERASIGQDEVKWTDGELAELLRLEVELKMTVDELKISIGPVAEGRERIVTQAVETSSDPSVYGIFPEEVWERILGELEDSKDIINVFEALPDLKGRVLKNKYWWLFDQVVPHLRGWINKKELLSCRLVCKKWAHGVENHLENLPFRNVVEHGRPITGQVWYPEGSRAYAGYTRRAWDIRGCEVSFRRRSSQLVQFLHDSETHPPTRNPFLGRSVVFYVPGSQNPVDNGNGDRVAYLNAAMEVLQKYGRHIWFLDLIYYGKNFCQLVLDVMYFVPNLKAMKLHGLMFDDHKSDAFQEWDRRVVFPRLRKLKSLNLRSMDHSETLPRSFMLSFVTCFSEQIQKLSIRQSAWMREYGEIFPNLRELDLKVDGLHDEIVGILTSLNAPDLVKLSVDVNVLEYQGALKITHVLSWVKAFPSLQRLDVDVTGDTDDDDNQVVGPLDFDSVPSITSVSISWLDVHLLGPAFLRCFPSLEYAEIYEGYEYYRNDSYPRPEWVEWFVSKNVYHWSLWEKLPSLKEVKFYPKPRPGLPTHYNRTTYELLQKECGHPLRRWELQFGIE